MGKLWRALTEACTGLLDDDANGLAQDLPDLLGGDHDLFGHAGGELTPSDFGFPCIRGRVGGPQLDLDPLRRRFPNGHAMPLPDVLLDRLVHVEPANAKGPPRHRT